MSNLRPKTVLRELTRLDLVYGGRKSGDELQALAKVFFEDCGHMNEARFIEACNQHRRRGLYFPSPAELIAAHDEIVANLPAPNQGLIEMPPELSDEQIRINKEGIRKMRERLARAKSMPDPYHRSSREKTTREPGEDG